MSETEAALIGAGAALVGAIVAGLVQLATTRLTVHSERRKIIAEAVIRAEEVRMINLLEVMSEMLALSDVEIHARFDYGRLLSLIHRAQLLIDRRIPRERELNGALNDLLFSLQRHVSAVQNAPDRILPSDEEEGHRRAILVRNARVGELGALVLRDSREFSSDIVRARLEYTSAGKKEKAAHVPT